LISEITQWIMELMRAHGQLSVFIGVMIEQIIVPIPSPQIVMGAGAIIIPPELHGKKEAVTIFFSRTIPVFPISLVSIFAGLLRIPLKPFTLYTFWGSIFRCLFLGFFGWWIGATYEKVATRLDSVETIVSILMLIGMGVAFEYLYYRFRRSNPSSGGRSENPQGQE
jgi:membrane protein DedA with SNARE-associated domain